MALGNGRTAVGEGRFLIYRWHWEMGEQLWERRGSWYTDGIGKWENSCGRGEVLGIPIALGNGRTAVGEARFLVYRWHWEMGEELWERRGSWYTDGIGKWESSCERGEVNGGLQSL